MPRTIRIVLAARQKGLAAGLAGLARPAAAADSVVSVTPASADVGTTVAVTITGAGFTSDSTPSFDYWGLRLSNVVVSGPTTMTATLKVEPDTPRGGHTLTVSEPGGAQVTCLRCFTATGVVLSSISPAQVLRGTATPLTLHGSGFTSDAVVHIDESGAVVTSQTYVSPTELRATLVVAADHLPETIGLGVLLGTGAQAGCQCITVVGTPVSVTSVTPKAVGVGGQFPVTIHGTGFVDHFATRVVISDTTEPIVVASSLVGASPDRRIVSSTEIDTYVYAGLFSAGVYDVTVSNFDGGFATCKACLVVGADGYWMAEENGTVHAFGDAPDRGGRPGATIADIEPAGHSDSYWLVDRAGTVSNHGPSAPVLGSLPAGTLRKGEEVTSLSSVPTGDGYWLFTTAGRVFAFGTAHHLGDMAATRLNGPVLDSVATPTGAGYFMVASDGGIFAFGDARFAGSMGGRRLNAPVQSLVPDGDGSGYWLVASDGGIFAFDASFRGSMGDQRLNRPVNGMVRYGNGYLMVASDGGIFNFSDLPFHGSLGANPPASPIVAVAARL